MSSQATSTSKGTSSKDADGPGVFDLKLLFSADHKDLMLIAYYGAVLKLFDGGAANVAPTKCTTAEIVVDWIAFVVVVVVYGVRHFAIKKVERPLWLRITRCVFFMLYLLSTHSQPISCSLSEGITSDDLHTLSYVQGAIQLLLALIATQLLVKQARTGSSGEQGVEMI